MNHAQETGMEVKGRLDIVISTGWHWKDKNTVELHPVHG